MSELAIQGVSGLVCNAEWGRANENVQRRDVADERVVALDNPSSCRRGKTPDVATAIKARTEVTPRDSQPAVLRDVTQLNPILLSMLVALQMLETSASNANSMSQQLTRATDLQAFLRNKQVEQYQEQINKAVEQADMACRAAIVNVVFDCVICAVEVAYGAFKITEGLASVNPLELADGAIFIMAGVIGMVKVSAELLMILGMDKAKCNAVINKAGEAQSVSEGLAVTLDVIQMGSKMLCATRAAVPVLEEGLVSEVGQQLSEAIFAQAEEEVGKLTEQLARQVSEKLSNNVGMAIEAELAEMTSVAESIVESVVENAVESTVEIGEEAISHSIPVGKDKNMAHSMGRSFTRDGIENLIKTSVTEGSKTLLKKEGQMSTQKWVDAILQHFRHSLVEQVINDASMNTILLIRAATGGVAKISAGIIGKKEAELRKQIEALIVQQRFNDFIDNWTEDRKKIQQQQLGGYLQQAADVLTCASAMMDDSGTVLARVAAGCA